MNTKTKPDSIRYHKERIRAYGPSSPMALGWNTKTSQELRFSVLAGIADLSGRSVLDLGCGRGDLSAFLGERFPNIRYTGIEQLEVFVDLANKRYGHLPNTRFIRADFLSYAFPPADFILVSGSLNYIHPDPDFIFKTIRHLFRACSAGFGFNLLSATGLPTGKLTAYDPETIRSLCKTLTPHVELKAGYLDGDYTLFLYR